MNHEKRNLPTPQWVVDNSKKMTAQAKALPHHKGKVIPKDSLIIYSPGLDQDGARKIVFPKNEE